MTDSQRKKRNFRNSKIWKSFRHIKYIEQGGKDFITDSKLSKTANLHHMDLNETHYTDLRKKENFIFLNKQTHDFVHWLFRYYRKNHDIMIKLYEVMEKMEVING